ncbi:MAG: Obg family GTPase CgtA [Candidatus Omnitrophica bacterium]|nr:Obg family GTPase CgtA [Candidatus Omnitrophota bacterium]
MFIDTARIKLKAGDGGNGCRSSRRRKNRRFSIPDGGSGGKGADIKFCVDSKVQTLLDFRYRQHFRAKNGTQGGSNCKKGKDAPELIIKVPPGTIIRDAELGLLLRDLTGPEEEVIAVKGGSGGRGNSSRRHMAEEGAKGEEKEVTLELKIIADVAIVGLPNAGKSSLITCLSHARPKIAAYPFTTKSPILGVFESSDFSFVLIDVPGLIEGAHLGKGMGDTFLRHIERTRLLLQVIDISNQTSSDPLSDYEIINEELKASGRNLEKKPRIIVANKIDLEGWQDNLKRLEEGLGTPVIAISCKEKQGLKRLIDEIKRKL